MSHRTFAAGIAISIVLALGAASFSRAGGPMDDNEACLAEARLQVELASQLSKEDVEHVNKSREFLKHYRGMDKALEALMKDRLLTRFLAISKPSNGTVLGLKTLKSLLDLKMPIAKALRLVQTALSPKHLEGGYTIIYMADFAKRLAWYGADPGISARVIELLLQEGQRSIVFSRVGENLESFVLDKRGQVDAYLSGLAPVLKKHAGEKEYAGAAKLRDEVTRYFTNYDKRPRLVAAEGQSFAHEAESLAPQAWLAGGLTFTEVTGALRDARSNYSLQSGWEEGMDQIVGLTAEEDLERGIAFLWDPRDHRWYFFPDLKSLKNISWARLKGEMSLVLPHSGPVLPMGLKEQPNSHILGRILGLLPRERDLEAFGRAETASSRGLAPKLVIVSQDGFLRFEVVPGVAASKMISAVNNARHALITDVFPRFNKIVEKSKESQTMNEMIDELNARLQGVARVSYQAVR